MILLAACCILFKKFDDEYFVLFLYLAYSKCHNILATLAQISKYLCFCFAYTIILSNNNIQYII